MKSLVVVKDVVATLPAVEAHEVVIASCLNAAEAKLYVATSTLDVSCSSVHSSKLDWRVSLKQLQPDASIVSFSYVYDAHAICIALADGDLLLLHCDSHDVEEVGSIDGGIAAMEWSPDGEALVIISGLGKLIMMNQEWELLEEVCLMSGDAASVDPGTVHISWRGDAKYFATACKPEASSSTCKIQIWDRNGCELHSTAEHADGVLGVIAWQPNGRHLYAAQRLADAAHVLLYEHNGLQHGGFDVVSTGAVGSMSWSSDSELLSLLLSAGHEASSTSSGHYTLQVWHRSNWKWYLKYERRYTNLHHAPRLHWDDVHAMWLHVITGSGVYERMQFHWDVHLSDHGTAAVVDGHNLLITPLRHGLVPPPMYAAKAHFRAPLVALAVSSSAISADELMACLMSDGHLAFLRSMEEDLWQETAEEHQEAFGSQYPSLMPMYSNADIPLAGGRRVRSICWLDASHLLAVAAPYPEQGLEGGAGDVLVEVEVQLPPVQLPEAGTPPVAAVLETPEVYAGGGVVVRVVPHPVCGALVQLDCGQLLHYQVPRRLTPLGPQLSFPMACPWVWPVPADVLNSQTSAVVAPGLGLSPQGQLYWGPSLVASEVTSVATRAGGPGGAALLYTTRKSLMYTVFFSQLAHYQHKELVAGNSTRQRQPGADDSVRPGASTTAARDVMVRAVEQGSQLVAASKGGVNVVLQMPRGNLEGNAPRALLLAAVVSALQRCDYAAAWDLAITNRVDLNLLVDYAWPEFLLHTHEFVQAVNKPSDLCDIMFALRPGSVVQEGAIYANIQAAGGKTSAAPKGEVDAELLSAGKVNAVCQALRAAVTAVDSHKYLSVIVTSFARSDPPQLDAALMCIREAKEAGLAAASGSPAAAAASSRPSMANSAQVPAQAPENLAEKALKHLLLTVDADELYRVALGMYELPLAYMVIIHAQKDPGEYLQELQQFAAIQDASLQRFHIDMHLQHFESALRHLVAAGPQHFPQALQIAQKHALLRLLLELYSRDSAQQALVLDAYGDALEQQNKHEDAAVAFVAAGQLDKALRAYRSASQWKMVFVVAARLQYTEASIQRLAAELCDELAVSGQLAAAAAVYLQYLQDVDSAVITLAKAREWQEAVRVAYQHQRADLVDTIVAPAAAEAAAGLLVDTREAVDRIHKYRARLKEVRRKRQALDAAVASALADAEDPSALRDELADNASTTASMVSGLSVYTENTHTGLTSVVGTSRPASTVGGKKAQWVGRKGKSKQNKIKHGSPHEEQALADHLRGLCPTALQLEEAGQLCELLIMLQHLQDARTLQQQLGAWIALHEDAIKDIAANAAVGSQHSAPPIVANKPAAPAITAWQSVQWKWDILRGSS